MCLFGGLILMLEREGNSFSEWALLFKNLIDTNVKQEGQIS